MGLCTCSSGSSAPMFYSSSSRVISTSLHSNSIASVVPLPPFSSSVILTGLKEKKFRDLWNSDDTMGIPIVKDNVCHQYFVSPVCGYLSTITLFSLMVKMMNFGFATLWNLVFTVPWVPIPFRNQERTCIECCATVNSSCFRWSICMQMIQCFSQFLLLQWNRCSLVLRRRS